MQSLGSDSGYVFSVLVIHIGNWGMDLYGWFIWENVFIRVILLCGYFKIDDF